MLNDRKVVKSQLKILAIDALYIMELTERQTHAFYYNIDTYILNL